MAYHTKLGDGLARPPPLPLRETAFDRFGMARVGVLSFRLIQKTVTEDAERTLGRFVLVPGEEVSSKRNQYDLSVSDAEQRRRIQQCQ